MLNRRIGATCLALALLPAGLAGAQETTEKSLEAVDVAAAHATQKAARSIVLLEVDHSRSAGAPLSAADRMRLGVRRSFDPRYFTRPEGPVSAVVIGPGLLATSMWNVVGDGSISVTTSDGTKLVATRAGRDENLRVTLLKVSDPDQKLVPIQASSASVAVGRTVFLVARTAVNAPHVTRGIVSGLRRERGDAFTHSAKTSFANSGGALVDLEGNLLGICVRHSDRSRQGQSSGVAFGARLTRVKAKLADLVAGKVIKKRPTAFLGIQMDTRFGGEGVKINKIIEGTGAKAAGIQDNDVITVFNNVKIKHFTQLVAEIQQLEVGKKIVITVKRGDQEMDYTVVLGARPADLNRRR